MGWTRYHVGAVTPASSDAAGIMAALASLFSVATDVDTGAAVSGLTWTRDTTAGSQAIYSSAFGPNNYRIIIACHDSGSPASGPTMVPSADTYTAANVLIGLAVNASGAYVNWYAAAPFSGCSFAGYYRLGPSANATLGDVRALVSTKDLMLQYRQNTSTIQTVHIGATLAAPTAYSESDGYRYGMMVSGAGGDMASDWRNASPVVTGYWTKNSTMNSQAHAGIYSIAGTTWQTVRVEHIRVGNPSTTDMGKWNSTGPVLANTGISFQRATSPESSVGWWAGVSDGPAGQTASVANSTGGSLWGWFVSSTHSGTEAAVVFAKAVS